MDQKVRPAKARFLRLLRWLDRDFDSNRPVSLAFIMLIPTIPLGLAFYFEASQEIVETTRLIAIIGSALVLAYYCYRASFNIWRAFKDFWKLIRQRK